MNEEITINVSSDELDTIIAAVRRYRNQLYQNGDIKSHNYVCDLVMKLEKKSK